MIYNENMRQEHIHKGQILLITLLVLSIATTIALSLIARTTTDLNISNETDESSRAFNAAEAGIEEALRAQVAPVGTQALSGNTSYTVTQTSIGGAAGAYTFPRVTSVGQTETLWLVNHNAVTGLPDTLTKGYTDNTIEVCLGDTTPKPAIEVIIYYIRGGEYRIARDVFDADSDRIANNNFSLITNTTGCGAGTNTLYRKAINFPVTYSINPSGADTLIMMRFRPLYANTQIAISATAAIPLQGNTYESCGTTGTGISRCISVIQNYRTPSGLFDYVIYSNQGSFAPTN